MELVLTKNMQLFTLMEATGGSWAGMEIKEDNIDSLYNILDPLLV